MTSLLADLRFALRGLGRSPLFAIVATLSLGLGIGANTAIFTLIDQILLRKLPVRAPEELVMLIQRGNHNGSNMGSRMHSYPIYQDYQQKAEPLSQVIARRLVSVSFAVDNQTERLDAEMVSGNYFSMLGVRPAIGRVLSSKEDDQVYNGHPVAVLCVRLLGVALRPRPRRHRQESADQQLPDDHRRGLGGRIRRPRPGAVAADPRADPDEAGRAARMDLDAGRRSALALGAGVRAAEAGSDRGKRSAADAGSVHTNPEVRSDAAGGQGLVGLLARNSS